MDELVSIIIPTFNRAFSVGEAIRSVQAQCYSTKQIIVIDDGSRDNTAQILKEFEGVEYYRQENKGQAAARNLGLRYARGEYIASLDSDDIWNREFLSNSIESLKKYNLDFVFSNWTSTDGKETFLGFLERKEKLREFVESDDDDWHLLGPNQVRRLFLNGNPSPSSSLLFRRSSLVSLWNEEVIAADDWFLVLDMVFSKSCRAAFTLSPCWSKRVFGDNIYDSRNRLEVINNAIHDERLMEERFREQLTSSERNILRKRLAFYYLGLGHLDWKANGFSKDVFCSVATAFKLAPAGTIFQTAKTSVEYIKCRAKKIFIEYRVNV